MRVTPQIQLVKLFTTLISTLIFTFFYLVTASQTNCRVSDVLTWPTPYGLS